MSWDQGFQPREEIPEVFVKWADARLSAPLSYITWFGSEPDIVYLEGEDGSRIKARVLSEKRVPISDMTESRN